MLQKLALTLRMIKVEHSVFALPFALISALVAAGGWPAWGKLGWILLAVVAARSCAMAFNRLVDSEFDRLNPRTRNWPLAAGLLSRRFVSLFVLICAALFVLAAYKLNHLAFKLSPVALMILLFYSLTKRFTFFSHWFIGLALAVGPAGAWIAIRGDLTWTPVVLGLSVLFWVAGFDLIYSCQDAEFDRSHHLYSIPSRFGLRMALYLSALCHFLTIVFLLWFGYLAGFGLWFYAGALLVTILLAYEHTIVSPADLSRVNEAFFMVNGLVSVLLLLFAGIDLYL